MAACSSKGSDQEPVPSSNICHSESAYGRFLDEFSRHHRQIVGYIYGLLHNHNDADDVFQRTSLVLWQKFDKFEPETDFVAWACRIAYLQTCNFVRTAGRDRLQFSNELLEILADERTEYQQESSRRALALRDCIEQLSLRHRNLIKQAYGEEGAVGRLAENLGRAVQTVYNQLSRIRRVLFRCVERRLETQEGVE